MKDYTKLITDLRRCQFGYCLCPECSYYGQKGSWDDDDLADCDDKMHLDAAAAIEELQAEVDKLKDELYKKLLRKVDDGKFEALQALLTEADKKQTYQHDCICELTAENEELQAELEKKRTADCWGCKCEKLEPKRGEIVRCKECIHFAQGGWCDREFDWFPVDENDFCSMAEKMEVQDGQK